MKDKETYYWNCPKCNTLHAEEVMQCEQVTKDGYCGHYCDGTALRKESEELLNT